MARHKQSPVAFFSRLGSLSPKAITDASVIKVLFITSMAAACLLIACGDKKITSPPDDENRSYFPLAVGNNWVYTWEDSYFGDNFSWAVVQVDGDTALIERPYADGPQFIPITVIQEGAEYYIKVAESKYEQFYRFMPDSTWTHRRPFDCDDSLLFRAVKDTTTIVTPAGSFSNCLKIERLSTSRCDDAGIMFEWWAPGVGMVKWEELNFYGGGPITGYLLSYHLEDR
ncbi:MAG: hypothetical protein V3W19_01665 [Desulfatiglandales bacterium]